MNTIRELIEDIQAGKMVILVDDENRENEGDLILAADFVTPQAINFMAKEARGLICLSMTSAQIQRLGLPQMVKDDFNLSPNKTAFTVSIEASSGVTTGISAADRSHTIRVAANPLAKPSDIIVPGHVFPIRALDGGVLKRAGHTEASVDLARLAGLNPAAVICEIMNSDGSMARVSELTEFARVHEIKIGTIEDLIKYRLENESFIEERAAAEFPTVFGEGFSVRVFRNSLNGREHVALTKGDLSSTSEPVLVRVHNENVLGDVFGGVQTPTGDSLKRAFDLINKAGRGVIVYLRQDDMALRLERWVASNLTMATTVDSRDYGVGAQILRALGLKRIVLLSNHPVPRAGLKGFGIEIVDQRPLLGVAAKNESHVRERSADV